MGDKDTALNQKTKLQTHAEYNSKKEGGQSFDNDVCAGEVIENVHAAAATAEHEEDHVDSCSSPASATDQLRDNHSSDGSSVDSQLLATDKAKTEMHQNAEQQEHLKLISRPNRLFKVCFISSLNYSLHNRL